MLVFPVLRRRTKGDQTVKVVLSYLTSSRPALDTRDSESVKLSYNFLVVYTYTHSIRESEAGKASSLGYLWSSEPTWAI